MTKDQLERLLGVDTRFRILGIKLTQSTDKTKIDQDNNGIDNTITQAIYCDLLWSKGMLCRTKLLYGARWKFGVELTNTLRERGYNLRKSLYDSMGCKPIQGAVSLIPFRQVSENDLRLMNKYWCRHIMERDRDNPFCRTTVDQFIIFCERYMNEEGKVADDINFLFPNHPINYDQVLRW